MLKLILNKINKPIITNIPKKRILLLVDMYDWSFHNIAKRIQKELTNYDIDILTTTELYKNVHNILKKKYNIFLFFFPTSRFSVDELNYIRNYNKSKFYWCLYENFIWRNINKVNLLQKVRIETYNNIKYWINYCDGYFYASPQIQRSLKKNFGTYRKPNEYCMDGVDTKMFYFKEYNKDIYTKEKLKIGWIGDSNPSMSGIQKGYNEIKRYVSDLSANFDFCPLDKQIKQIPHNEVPNYIHNIDIIVCYSTCEGTPNQILEGSSCGRCWISTDVGIVSSVYNTIEDNPTGIIIKKNEKAFKDALMKLYNNRELIVEYGRNGRKAIEVKWDWKYRLEGFQRMFDIN